MQGDFLISPAEFEGIGQLGFTTSTTIRMPDPYDNIYHSPNHNRLLAVVILTTLGK